MNVLTRFKQVTQNVLPGVSSACLMLVLLKLGVAATLEQAAYSSLFRIRGSNGWDERIVTVEIDDKSLAALGHFPLPRHYYTQLLETLAPSNPGVIAFDLLFLEPSPDDSRFASAIADQDRVVLAQAWDSAAQQLLPQVALEESAIATGHIHKIIESDGSTRQMYLAVDGVSSLAIATLQAYGLSHSDEFTLPQSTEPVWINWPGPSQQAVRYSFVDVVEGRIPIEAFTDKIVMVGVTATGLDTLVTPYDNHLPGAGIFLQVSLIDNVLNGTLLKPVNPLIWMPLLLLGGPGLSLLLSHRRVSTQLLLWAIAGLGWGSVGLLAFSMTYWLPIVGPITLMSLTSCTLLLTERLRLDRQLRQAIQTIGNVHEPQPFSSSRLLSESFLNHRPKPIPIQPLLQDVSQLANLTQQLSTQTWTDTLTHIANRQAFEQYLSQAWAQATQGQMPISLVLCEVDHFKRYTDTYGNLAGDDCLRKVAQTMTKTTRRSADFVARYDDTAFAILLPNTDHQGAHRVIEQISNTIRTLQLQHDQPTVVPQITLSAGVATLSPQSTNMGSADQLIRVADQRLGEAKATGHNHVVMTTPTPQSR